MASRKDLENLLVLILAAFLIVLIWYAFKSLDNESLFIITQDATWFSVTFAFIVIFLSFEGIHENDLVIVFIISILIVMIAMQCIALLRTSPSDSSFDKSNTDNDDSENTSNYSDND